MLKKKPKYAIAVAGATGAVGREMIEILEERKFPVSELIPLSSDDSEGDRVEFNGRKLTVRKLAGDAFHGVDIAFFCVGVELSKKFVPSATEAGAVVIDDSNAFRMDKNIPLVIPEVNARRIASHNGIIANPNCSTIAMALVLKPIHDAVKVRRIVATTFQSVSGTGKHAIDELAAQTVALLNFRDIEKHVYPHQIAFNCFPHIDSFLDDGTTREEMKMANEMKKILEDDSLRMTATAVRVPIFRCHSAAVNVETEKGISANEVRAVLSGAPGVIVYDDPSKNLYPLAIDVAGKDEVYVGRIRVDESIPNGINMWIVSDNLRKGAALNAVQIAEQIIR